MKRRHLLGLSGITSIVVAGTLLFYPLWTPRIVAYRHETAGSATIAVRGTPASAFVLSSQEVPAEMGGTSVNRAALRHAWPQALPVSFRLFSLATAFTLNFPEDQSSASGEQNHVLVLYPLGCAWLAASTVTALQDMGLCGSAGYLEIIRQSPAYLKSRYGFDKPDGYSIAGRRSVGLPRAAEKTSVEAVNGSGLPLIQLPQIEADIAARIDDAPRELKQAARLIAMMNEKPLRVGPSATAPDASRDAALRLSQLQDGEAAVQCQGFRDIWLELAVRVPGIERARPVSAYNYFPPFADLITFSHALAEIHLRDEGRWILVDPWLGFALRHGGRFLSVAELADLRRDVNAVVEVVPLVPEIRRFVVASDESRAVSASTVPQTAPPMRSGFTEGRYRFGYLDYFVSVSYGPEYRRAAPVASGAP